MVNKWDILDLSYIGQFQKISIPSHGRLPCFNPPPCLQKFQNALPPPPCPQNSIIVNPPPVQNFCFFFKYIFDLVSALQTNECEFMPPQDCDLAAPGDKLYSSATSNDKKNLMLMAGYANSFLSLNLAIKINTPYGSFTPLCFLVFFWRLQSKITQTVKIFRRAKYCRVFELSSLRPFICHVVRTKSVLNP